MDIRSLLNPATTSPAPVAPVTPLAPVASPPTPPKTPEPLRFHHYGAGDEGVTDLGIDISIIPISTTPTSKKPTAPIEYDRPRQGVSGRRKNKIPVDPRSVPDGTGDKQWEQRREKMGGPKDGIHAFRLNIKS